MSINTNDSTKKQAALDQQTLKSLLHYDPFTGVFTWLVKRGNKIKAGSIAGYVNQKYWRIRTHGSLYMAHRLAWLYMTGVWPEFQIDHEDLNKINNIWSNLREATGSQNKGNINVQSNNKLKVKGVVQRSHGYEVNFRRKYLGSFPTIEEAKSVYDVAAKAYYGEFARS